LTRTKSGTAHAAQMSDGEVEPKGCICCARLGKLALPHAERTLTAVRVGPARGQVSGDLGELIEGGLQVFDDLGGEYGGVRKIRRIAEAVIAEPEKYRGWLVAFDQVFVGKNVEALGFGALVAVLGFVGVDEVVEVGVGKSTGFQGEVLIGTEIVIQSLRVQGCSLAGLRSKKRTLALTPWA